MILKNVSLSIVQISDLALMLSPDEEINILESFTNDQIKRSSHLQSVMDNSLVSVTYNNDTISHTTLIQLLTSLTVSEHQQLDTLIHGISESSYFESQKVDDQTKYIRTYVDNTKSKLIREEEIVRDQSGNVGQIIIRQYDGDGNLVESEIQTLNRSAEGTVESISSSAG